MRDHTPISNQYIELVAICSSVEGCSGLNAYLRFVESGLLDFFVEGLGYGGTFEDAILAEEEPVLEGEFSEREADDQPLPWEERPVEPEGQTLLIIRH